MSGIVIVPHIITDLPHFPFFNEMTIVSGLFLMRGIWEDNFERSSSISIIPATISDFRKKPIFREGYDAVFEISHNTAGFYFIKSSSFF